MTTQTKTTVFGDAPAARRIGYARVSTRDQVLDSQLRALEPDPKLS